MGVKCRLTRGPGRVALGRRPQVPTAKSSSSCLRLLLVFVFVSLLLVLKLKAPPSKRPQVGWLGREVSYFWKY